jgi:hypothetical protein
MNPAPSPFRHHQAQVPSNHVNFSDLTATVLMDEEFENYQFIHHWMRDFIDMDDWRNLVRDIALHTLTANKNVLLKFTFTSAFPTALSELMFDSAIMDSTQMTFNVTFAYQYFTFEKITIAD